MVDTRAYPRIVLGLTASMWSRGPIEAAADIAAWLGSRIEAVLMSNDELASLSAAPFAREFQPLLGAWREFGADRLLDEHRIVAAHCARLFDTIASAAGVHAIFHEAVGDPSAAFAKFADALDLIAISEPSRRGEASIEPYPSLLAAASAAASPVLFLPQLPIRRSGPILVVGEESDPAFAVGVKIARATGEALVLACSQRPQKPNEGRDDYGLQAGRFRRVALSQPPRKALLSNLRDLHERIVVISASAVNHAPPSWPLDVLAVRRVPLLIMK